MKTPERFNRAIKALVQAFFNDTLAKYHCMACAVGNICAAAIDYKIPKDFYDTVKYPYGSDVGVEKEQPNTAWRNLILRNSKGSREEALAIIEKTGYTVDELAAIESTFEKNTFIKFRAYSYTPKSEIMQDQFNGLMAVVEVLCQLDNIEPTEYKKAFEYTADFKPVTILSEVD